MIEPTDEQIADGLSGAQEFATKPCGCGLQACGEARDLARLALALQAKLEALTVEFREANRCVAEEESRHIETRQLLHAAEAERDEARQELASTYQRVQTRDDRADARIRREAFEEAAKLDDDDAAEYERVADLPGVSPGSKSQLRGRMRDCLELAARIRALAEKPSGEETR